MRPAMVPRCRADDDIHQRPIDVENDAQHREGKRFVVGMRRNKLRQEGEKE